MVTYIQVNTGKYSWRYKSWGHNYVILWRPKLWNVKPIFFWISAASDPRSWATNEFSLNGAELSLNSMNSVNSENLRNHWSMNWVQYEDLLCYMCLCGTVVSSLFLTQEILGSNPAFLLFWFLINGSSLLVKTKWTLTVPETFVELICSVLRTGLNTVSEHWSSSIEKKM